MFTPTQQTFLAAMTVPVPCFVQPGPKKLALVAGGAHPEIYIDRITPLILDADRIIFADRGRRGRRSVAGCCRRSLEFGIGYWRDRPIRIPKLRLTRSAAGANQCRIGACARIRSRSHNRRESRAEKGHRNENSHCGNPSLRVALQQQGDLARRVAALEKNRFARIA
jgi:hypothetical protein